MRDLGGGSVLESRNCSRWGLGFSEEAVQGPNFEFGVVRPKIRSLSQMSGYCFKHMVSPEIR
jgi:hypothetical protein